MISVELAAALRRAGLPWTPAEFDRFAVIGRDGDAVPFVIAEMPASLVMLHGELAIAFHGASEWALDHVLHSEVVWLPDEAQLRDAIEGYLAPHEPLELQRGAAGYRCRAGRHSGSGSTAAEAYGHTLLAVLVARQ